jgi:hypothetical protein
MTPHLSDEDVLDLVLAEAPAPRPAAHAQACASCGARVAETRAALELARLSDVPEPSPFYWQSLRRGVSERIEREGQGRRLRVFLVPALAAAGLVAALVALPGPKREAPRGAALQPWSALPTESEDDELAVLEGLALASAEVGEWSPALGLGSSLASLSEDESRALVEGLRDQAQGGES